MSRREECPGNAGKRERAEIAPQIPSGEQEGGENEPWRDKDSRENGGKGLWGGEEKRTDRGSGLWEVERKRRTEEKMIRDSEGSGKGRSSGGRVLQKEEGLQGKRKEDRESGWSRGEKDGNGMRNSMGNTGGSPGRGHMEEKPVQLLEDKWQQLYAIYPHIRPFDDDREYISIKPADFVLFPAESYRIVNNSFLLHGYYNYRHLILAKAERKGETVYYIGVPGNFYEKEKQVAIMFGFESFECAEEPAQAGDFGYYMMRTQL